ncbi:MAG: hypothetical protein HYX75_02295 [Acidobacteria bacterium]|nr:hypothetical protein [Acidobacteriota bacterium]
MRFLGWVLVCALAVRAPCIWCQQEDEEELERELGSLLEMLGGGETISEEELKARVEEIGGLRLLRPLPIQFMSKTQLKTYLDKLFSEEYPVDLSSKEAEALSFFGLIPRDYDLRGQRARLLYENIAGFYNEKSGSKALYAVSNSSKIDYLNGLILAHEVRHAIQDQHFDLERRLPPLSDFDDRKLAVLALYEGDATVVMMRFMGMGSSDATEGSLLGMLGGGSGDSAALVQMAAGMVGGSYASAPEVLQRQLLLPYVEGARFIEAIDARGGIAAVNAALSSPPESSEQVLHPEKYTHRDRPEAVQFDMSRETAGQRLVHEGVLGEFYMRSLFGANEGEAAAAGWDGDYYQLFRDSSGARTLVWKLAWDSPADGEEFAAAWKHRAGREIVSHGGILDGKDHDGILFRIANHGMSTTFVKSEVPGNLVRFTGGN